MDMENTDPRIALAAAALTNLYDSWERDGGCSPDTRDEHREVALAVGVTPWAVADAATYDAVADKLETVWEIAQSGAEIDEIAAAHLAAIDGR